MDRSRIVITTAAPDLPAPHFDDEATLVSARQVVPIAKARLVERKRAAPKARGPLDFSNPAELGHVWRPGRDRR